MRGEGGDRRKERWINQPEMCSSRKILLYHLLHSCQVQRTTSIRSGGPCSLIRSPCTCAICHNPLPFSQHSPLYHQQKEPSFFLQTAPGDQLRVIVCLFMVKVN